MEPAAGGSAEIKAAPTGMPVRLLSGALLFCIFCQHKKNEKKTTTTKKNYWVNQRKSNSRKRPARSQVIFMEWKILKSHKC